MKGLAFIFPLALCCGSLSLGVAAESASSGSVTAMLAAKVIIGLTLILLLIALFAWLAKTLGYANFTGQTSQIKVLASLPLGTREKALLIDVGGKWLFIGVSPAALTTLYAFDDSEKQQAIEQLQAQGGGPQANTKPQTFSGVLKSLLVKSRVDNSNSGDEQ